MDCQKPEGPLTPDLRSYDWIVINTSAGKDSQAMLEYVWRLAGQAGVRDRLVAVHADLGRAEWPGTRELAEFHARWRGIPFFVAQRKQWLLEQISSRGMFPDSGNRYCTSDHKRDQVAKLLTQLATERIFELSARAWRETPESKIGKPRPIRILNCMGLRADESPARAKRIPIQRDARASNGKRHVDTWLPLHSWTSADVWNEIERGGMPHHYAYDLGMPRLSCVFCIFAPESALLLAGYHNRNLLAEYVAVEKSIDHTFRHKQSLADVQRKLDAGFVPESASDWKMS